MVSKKTLVRISFLSILTQLKRNEIIDIYNTIKIHSLKKMAGLSDFLGSPIEYSRNVFSNSIKISSIEINLLLSSLVLIFLSIYFFTIKKDY